MVLSRLLIWRRESSLPWLPVFGAVRRSYRNLAARVLGVRYALKKAGVAKLFGDDGSARPEARLHFRSGCQSPACAIHVEAAARQLRICADADANTPLKRMLWPTALILDLNAFETYAAYLDFVAKSTGGRYRRSANKARRLGYSVRSISLGSNAESHRRIVESATWRSHGMVLPAIWRVGPALEDREDPEDKPNCDEHWARACGVFGPFEGKQRMVAKAVLRRAGNVVVFDFLMGHVDTLKDGVMKLLMFEIMKPLIGRDDPTFRGLDYAFQGIAETGNKGILDWKRYVGFRPRLLRLVGDQPFQFPEGFDPRAYLRLNPDVAKLGEDPRHHFIYHGFAEGRPYRDEP